MHFTQEELAIAKSVDLCQVASNLGYTVESVGRYHTLKEMDSIRIYNRLHWFRWSRKLEQGENGGSQIDFLRVFAGLEVKEAVFWLLDFAGYCSRDVAIPPKKLINPVEITKAPKEFVLPFPAANNQYLYSYLEKERYISRSVIDYFVNNQQVYEAKQYHNMVFLGKDKDGVTRFASMRGVFDKDGKGFKCDVAGNDKNYGFNVVNQSNDELIVFEAVIDLMSYVDIFSDFETNKIALGMLADAPVETFLKEYNHIKKIRLCLDNDEPGRVAAKDIMTKYQKCGYEVIDSPAPQMYKDYNEWLRAARCDTKKQSNQAVVVKSSGISKH